MTFEELLERELQQEAVELSRQKLRDSFHAADENSNTEIYLEQK